MKRPHAAAAFAKIAEKTCLCVLSVLCGCLVCAAPARAQMSSPARLAIMQAEDRRAPTANDVAILRSGAHSADALTARMAIRALGRLERPSLLPDIIGGLRQSMPENRIEAATAIGQAAQGWKRSHATGGAAGTTIESIVATLVARLRVDDDADVRGAICETIGRLPYTTAAQVDTAEKALVDVAARSDYVGDRLGVAKGLEALARINKALRPASESAIGVLRRLAVTSSEAASGARVRRLALEGLITTNAASEELIASASHDSDAQVRRLAMRAAAVRGRSTATEAVVLAALGNPASTAAVEPGRGDESPMVRLEALRALKTMGSEAVCAASILRAWDRDAQVALQAIDLVAGCGASPVAIGILEYAVADNDALNAPRGWHRAAHAIVAMAAAAPERSAAALTALSGAKTWQVRMYAARAAAALKDRATLERFAGDDSDNVREAAVTGLKAVAGHDADRVYIAQLSRSGNQVLRAAAAALDGTPHADEAVPALKATLARLVSEGRDNSHDARTAIVKTLNGGQTPELHAHAPQNDLNADELRRLASPRARITIKDVGAFELALFTVQAPATVMRFARLAEAGYYNGLTFHRIVPNFVIQGGSPGANEYVGDAAFMRDELGSWPHVRGAVGISTRGRDTGDAQIFVDLVDNPRLDHDYTVFAQILNGIDVVDRILEGDVIETVEILPK